MNNVPSVKPKTDSFGMYPTSGWQNPTASILAHLKSESPESSYFVQGGCNLNSEDMSKLDRTLTMRVQNLGVLPVNAILFGTRQTPDFEPFFGTSFITLPDLVDNTGVPVSQEVVRNELVTNVILISGIKMIFPNGESLNLTEQQMQPMTLRRKSIIGGASDQYMYQTLNAISPTNADNKIIDIPEAVLSVDSETDIFYPILPGEEVWFVFTLKARLNSADFLFQPNPKIQVSKDPRQTGNPIADMFLLDQKATDKLVDNTIGKPVV